MSSYACPACGAPVRFQSRISVFCVCAYCSQMLVRRDLDVEAIGKMALLIEDSSPLQITTQGKYEGRNFALVGRLRQHWTDGNWNEWFAQFDDGTQGWLAEAQGFYMMSFASSIAEKLPDVATLRAGQKLILAGIAFEIEDIKSATCVGSQGELPFRAPQGRVCTSVDLVGKNAFASLDYSAEGTVCYLGKYVEFNEFHFSNLREIDGW
jgi:hypothetical protein